MAITKDDVVEYLKGMSLLEASELVKELEEVFGVSAAAAAAPMMMAAARGAGGDAAPAAEEKDTFDVVLDGRRRQQDRRDQGRSRSRCAVLASKKPKTWSTVLRKPLKEGVSKAEADRDQDQADRRRRDCRGQVSFNRKGSQRTQRDRHICRSPLQPQRPLRLKLSAPLRRRIFVVKLIVSRFVPQFWTQRPSVWPEAENLLLSIVSRRVLDDYRRIQVESGCLFRHARKII